MLVFLLVVYLVVLSGREVFFTKTFPAVSVEKNRKISVLVEGILELEGLYQFNDDIDPATAIELTIFSAASWRQPQTLSRDRIIDGSRLVVLIEDHEIIDIKYGWMPASQRLALGIKLHPDRMTREDWEVLPGIGARLAEKIDKDRQKNGVFRSLEGVGRVSGIGNRSIERWKCFF
jgi:competence protein ComEA